MELHDVDVRRIYPPSRLSDFQKCPRLYDYKQRWASKKEQNSTALVIGSAVAAGLEAHYEDRGRDSLVVAAEYVDSRYVEGSDRSLKGVQTLVRSGVRHGVATNLGLTEVLAVERFFGNVRPDLVGRDPNGRLVVVDHKVKVNLDDRYKEKELLGYDTSNQLFHYAWAVGQDYGESVTEVVIHLIVLAPRVYTEVHPIHIDKEHLVTWLYGAARDWRDMDAGVDRPRFESCMGKYGACDYYSACHTLYGDESKFDRFYTARG